MKKQTRSCEQCLAEEMKFLSATAPMVTLEPISRIIYIIGEITVQTLHMFVPIFTKLDETKGPIIIRIASMGGDVGVGLAIYDLLKASKNVIITEGYGMVYSMGAALLQAGDIRKLSENVRFMIHSASIGLPEAANSSILHIENNELIKVDEILLKILKKRSKLTKSQLNDYYNKDVYFSAIQAKKAGLCDTVIKNRKVKNVK